MLGQDLGDGARLGPLEPWQAAEFAAFVDRARGYLSPWIGWVGFVTDEAGAARFLTRYARSAARDGGRIYGLWQDGTLVGGAVFRVFDVSTGVCELGVWLAPDAQGRGLITRAAREMIDWAVRVRGMVRVEWRAAATNTRSLATARRLGMTREGLLRQAFVIRGVRHDVEVWSILADEWRALRTP